MSENLPEKLRRRHKYSIKDGTLQLVLLLQLLLLWLSRDQKIKIWQTNPVINAAASMSRSRDEVCACGCLVQC